MQARNRCNLLRRTMWNENVLMPPERREIQARSGRRNRQWPAAESGASNPKIIERRSPREDQQNFPGVTNAQKPQSRAGLPGFPFVELVRLIRVRSTAPGFQS
jgi:hypothetical protein